MKGIIMAGGSGTRLLPLTTATSKQLLPVYDKPMIYYPISTLMLAGIREILIITTGEHQSQFKELLGDGSSLGLRIQYAVQDQPRGISEAFILGADFIGKDSVCLILGDNIFYGHGFVDMLKRSSQIEQGAVIYGYYVNDPQRYGVVEFDANLKVHGIEEKPADPKSNYAVTGLYFYDNRAVEMARNLKPSLRGELEITDLNKLYLARGELRLELLGRGFAWLDTGTHKSLMEASKFVQVIEERQGLKLACVEEIAFKLNLINADQLRSLAAKLGKSDYGQYLLDLLDTRKRD
ncbi:MAG TPA: glucose-1-phosphate thymidylyltransferase RfbA, partial [Leptospiraceae bacterium]|nr:glucose-1-phosphate thymidylyltransferase RfbA [Leptospiraceae bacterium]